MARRHWQTAEGKRTDEYRYDPNFYDRYLGAEFAYEPCPHYRRRVRENIDNERARRLTIEAPMYGET